MFGKKKREAEARARAEAEARERARREEEARRNAAPKVRSASWRKVSEGPVPIAKPADFIQLTPIVQPVPLVPYSTQLQPLATYEEDYDYVEEDEDC